MGELIPLFPLGTPLFPGVVLPLQIFEPRYRRLMRDLLSHPEAGDRRFFGVVAIRQGWEVEAVAPAEALYDIGCVARVQAVRPQSDGGFRIVTVGGERFRLLDVVVGDDPPYLQAEVEWLAEEEAAEEAAGNSDGLVIPGTPGAPSDICDEQLDEVVASVARGSMDLLSRGVRTLFTRYVAEVAGLSSGGAPRLRRRPRRGRRADGRRGDRRAAGRGGRRPDGAVLPGGVGGPADHRGPAGAAGRVRHPPAAGHRVAAAAPRADPAADAGRGAGAAARSSPAR